MFDHVVFIHGRQESRSERWRWLYFLNDALTSQKLIRFTDKTVQLHRPTYLDVLDNRENSPSPPARTAIHEESVRRARQTDHEYRQRLRAIAAEHKEHIGPVPLNRMPGREQMTTQVIERLFDDVRTYGKNPGVRNAIFQHLLPEMPQAGSCLLIGHSLGSVVALDLLRYLSSELRIDLLITCGSPVGIKVIRSHLEGRGESWPYDRVRAWLNVYDPSDIVTGGHKLGRYSPAVDLRVNNPGGRRERHAAGLYLRRQAVVEALMLAAEIPRARRPRKQTKPDEYVGAVLNLAYAEAIQAHTLSANARKRMRDARRMLIQEEYAEALPKGPPEDLQGALERLSVGWTTERRLHVLVELCHGNPFQPFAIKFSERVREEALCAVGRSIDAPENGPAAVISASEQAMAAHKCGRRWPKVAAIALGGAVAIALPMAVPFLGAAAGAAAITSGLAALGAGGMVGGLWMLSVAGAAGGLALRHAVAELSPEQLEMEIVKLQTSSAVRRRLAVTDLGAADLELVKSLLADAERQRGRHGQVSDKGTDSPSYKGWDEKRKTLARARKWLEAEKRGEHDPDERPLKEEQGDKEADEE